MDMIELEGKDETTSGDACYTIDVIEALVQASAISWKCLKQNCNESIIFQKTSANDLFF